LLALLVGSVVGSEAGAVAVTVTVAAGEAVPSLGYR
jgi:hypothetical protein